MYAYLSGNTTTRSFFKDWESGGQTRVLNRGPHLFVIYSAEAIS